MDRHRSFRRRRRCLEFHSFYYFLIILKSLSIQNGESLFILLGIFTFKSIFLILCQFYNLLYILRDFLGLLVCGISFLMISCYNTELSLPIQNLATKTRILISCLLGNICFYRWYFIVQGLVIDSYRLVTHLHRINFESVYLKTLFIRLFSIYLYIISAPL